MELAWRKRNLLILAAAMALLLTLIPMRAFAQAESTVNATVTPAFVAVSTLPVLVEYGVKVLGSMAQTPTPDNFVATNDGNITADFLIRGDDTADWILAGTADAEIYVHRASPDAFTTTIVLTTTKQPLESGIGASGTSTVSHKHGSADLHLRHGRTDGARDRRSHDTVVAAEHGMTPRRPRSRLLVLGPRGP